MNHTRRTSPFLRPPRALAPRRFTGRVGAAAVGTAGGNCPATFADDLPRHHFPKAPSNDLTRGRLLTTRLDTRVVTADPSGLPPRPATKSRKPSSSDPPQPDRRRRCTRVLADPATRRRGGGLRPHVLGRGARCCSWWRRDWRLSAPEHRTASMPTDPERLTRPGEPSSHRRAGGGSGRGGLRLDAGPGGSTPNAASSAAPGRRTDRPGRRRRPRRWPARRGTGRAHAPTARRRQLAGPRRGTRR